MGLIPKSGPFMRRPHWRVKGWGKAKFFTELQNALCTLFVLFIPLSTINFYGTFGAVNLTSNNVNCIILLQFERKFDDTKAKFNHYRMFTAIGCYIFFTVLQRKSVSKFYANPIENSFNDIVWLQLNCFFCFWCIYNGSFEKIMNTGLRDLQNK